MILTVGGCGGDGGADTGAPDPLPEAASGSASPTSASVAAPVSSFEVVPTPSLADNLLGDPAELEVAVRLPASYASSSRRYPVVYFLAGYGEAASTSILGPALDELVAAGLAPEMILIGIDGDNALGGSFYVDSPVTGAWSRAIHTDVVGWVDRTYRTLATPESRGIAGFSMGGFGALDLAMRHADVFGSVYALSPGLFAPGGLEQTVMFEDDDAIADFLALEGDGSTDIGSIAGEALRFTVAYGAAFAPDVGAGFPWVAYPFASVDGPRDEAIWARWDAGYGGVADEIEEFADELRSLRGIALDYGTNDRYAWIPTGTQYFADQLAAHGVSARVTTYDGGHGPVGPRAGAVMFPFFADVLDA